MTGVISSQRFARMLVLSTMRSVVFGMFCLPALCQGAAESAEPLDRIVPEPVDPSILTWAIGAMVLLMVGIFLYLARKGSFFPYGAAGLSTMGLGALVVLQWRMELTSLKGITVFVVWTITLLLLIICAVRSIGVGRHSKVAGPVAIFALISVMLSVIALFLLLAPWRE